MASDFFREVQRMSQCVKRIDLGDLSSSFCLISGIVCKSNEIWKKREPKTIKRLAPKVYDIADFSKSCDDIEENHSYSIGPTGDGPVKNLNGVLLPPLDNNNDFFILMGVKCDQNLNRFLVHLHLFHQEKGESSSRIMRFRYEKHEHNSRGEKIAHKHCHVHVDEINGATKTLSRGAPRIPIEVDAPSEMLLVALSSFYNNKTVESIIPGGISGWNLRCLK